MESTKNHQILLKRAYQAPDPSDGYRIYIDRLWPQGLSHDTFPYDWWDKTISPTSDLRQWFHADPENRWDEFVKKYTQQLEANPAFAQLLDIVKNKSVVTLLYSSHDTEHNNAVIVRNLLLQKLKSI